MDAIFRNDYGWLLRWLSKRTPLGHMPEDLASETFVRMINVAQRQTILEPRAIMTTIAKRIVYDLRARNTLQQAYEAALQQLPAALEPSPEERLIVLEALRRIEYVLQPLSANIRAAFLMNHVDGMRHAEIAACLGVSVSMVRKYLATAMKACYREAMLDE